MKSFDKYIKEIEKKLSTTQRKSIKTEEVGTVVEVKDGVIQLQGLDNVGYGELIQFQSGVRAMIIDLTDEGVQAIVLGEYLDIKAHDLARATGITLSIPVSKEVLGRVVNPLGEPVDGGQKIAEDKLYPIEKKAPGVVERKSVSVPLQTGIKAIDSLVPIGRGQRELIIGDRGVGKTTIALDTILNQKNSEVANTVELLRQHDALKYSVIVSASASESATLQYLAPYSAAAIAEYFMDKGKDVLVIYDDLSKHAWAYRQISLILRRPAGREAYPGDVFYLHSRLLERSARMSGKEGGGSITSFPIIETQAGDVASYIPTNVISITDGQIYLETDLFNAGTRPAINAGLSVSRVGGAAQTGIMKQVSGPLRLELAQFRSLAAFVQFGSDLDEQTQKQLERGRRVAEILKQPQFTPLDEAQEVISIFAASRGLLDDLAISKIRDFETKVHDFIKVKNKKLWAKISSKEKMDDKTMKELSNEIENFKKSFK